MQQAEDINYHIYPKLNVQDDLSRIIQGKNEKGKQGEDFKGNLNAFSNVNEQIAQRLLDQNGEPMRLLQVKPGVDGVAQQPLQRYAPYLDQSKFLFTVIMIPNKIIIRKNYQFI